ncbi:septum formation initiator [Bacillus tropicus]|nr:septum formation initiator [Bacillus tropicus]MEC2918636.1 septum formation initiator [Bacillus tropicus]MEC2923967.1 septum formation initiator [Bacillus tropicus]MEC2954252.1 septum formation initiator [Bacillus tropicus]MEC3047643.1 septum formation initiator [Bacillus tropicus]MEC3077307.1 septum formation initiator [Bacillus tropicus]
MRGDAILSKKKKSNDALAIGVGIGVIIGVVQGYFTNNLVIVIGIAFLKK